MTIEQFDKIMKPYWDDVFKDSYFSKWNGIANEWFGLVKKNPDGDEKLIIGYPIKDNDESIWYYDGQSFLNHNKVFNISIIDFRFLMTKYLNEKYNLKIKSVV